MEQKNGNGVPEKTPIVSNSKQPQTAPPSPGNNDSMSHIAAIGDELKAVADDAAPDLSAVYNNLEKDKKGNPKNTRENYIVILENDPQLSGHIYLNTFKGIFAIRGGMPWNKTAYQWSDNDDANLRVYIEKNYKLSSRDKLADALFYVTNKHREHPIRKYLTSLEWDGVERLDRLIIDYVGAENTPLNRAFTRKWFVAAVARAMSDKPIKFDNCLTLSGKQHSGKSLTFRTMANINGNEWFQDSIDSFNGKDPMEQIQGYWIVELAEMSAINNTSIEKVKNFLSKSSDDYRNTYGRNVENHRRQCVFCSTTNEAYFLKGNENRRFWVIRIDPSLRSKGNGNDASALEHDRDQLWAEAFYRWQQGESLELSNELYNEALNVQRDVNALAADTLTGPVVEFAKAPIPTDWEQRDLQARRDYWRNRSADNMPTRARTKICAAEYLCEKCGMEMKDKGFNSLVRKVNAILAANLNWKEGRDYFPPIYARQRGFIKPSEDKDLFADG